MTQILSKSIEAAPAEIAELESDGLGIQRLVFSLPVDHSGTTIHVKGWCTKKSSGNPLIFVHGSGEHSGFYSAAAQQFCNRGVTCYSFDLRGHGKSGKRTGHINRFKVFINDLLQVAAWVRHRESGCPPIIVGEGTGALTALRFAAEFQRLTASLILISPSFERQPSHLSKSALFPWIGLSFWKDLIVKVLAEMTPTARLPSMLMPRLFEPHRAAEEEQNLTARILTSLGPKQKKPYSARYVDEILRAAHLWREGFSRILVPTLLLLPEEDDIWSQSAVKKAAKDHEHSGIFTTYDLAGSHPHVLGSSEIRDHAVDLIYTWIDQNEKNFKTQSLN